MHPLCGLPQNPDCEIPDEYNCIEYSAIICGYKGSTAEAYADRSGNYFEYIGDIVISLSGHDCGRLYVVMGVEDDSIILCDGKRKLLFINS